MISQKIQTIHRTIISSPSPSFLIILFRGGLYLLSLLYLFFSSFSSFLYKCKIRKIKKLPKPVISIGNISAGGTGKTPLCIELIQLCLDIKKKPALVSRGYGNDESLVYQNRFPNISMAFSADRFKTCSSLLEVHPEIDLFILDDAFQHQKLFRDLNILLINASNPFGYNYCLPRGYLRESMKAMNRADLVILTHADEVMKSQKEEIKNKINMYVKENTQIIEATHEPSHFLSPEGKCISFAEIAALNFKNTGVLCGIAHPDGFLKTLKKCNITPTIQYFYSDHHQYLTSDFQKLVMEKENFNCLITTEKDIVKIPNEMQIILNIYTLRMQLKLSAPDQLTQFIKEIV